MHLFTFKFKDTPLRACYAGVVKDGTHFKVEIYPGRPDPVKELIVTSKAEPDALERLLNDAPTETLDLEQIIFQPPVLTSQKIICVGLNYRDHAREGRHKIPSRPIIFSKFPTALTGHKNDVPLPLTSNQVDFEGELAVYIGRKTKRIRSSDAFIHVAGYTVFNDVSARDFQFNDGQWIRGKSCDSFAPVGPYLITADEIPDPHSLGIKTFVNGTKMQDSTTANLIFDIPTLIEFISQEITLLPGDIIATGTPSGVGCYRIPPVFLKKNDIVSISIDSIGVLENRFV